MYLLDVSIHVADKRRVSKIFLKDWGDEGGGDFSLYIQPDEYLNFSMCKMCNTIFPVA